MLLNLAVHFVIGFPLGIFAANAGEWVIHKRVLHGMGKKKGNFWNFHWYEHHNEARRNEMLDAAYASGWVGGGWNGRTKEALALLSGLAIWVPLLWVVPGFAAAILYGTVNYYYKHKRAHLDPEWARRHLPWHVDHHMGANQDANWCVTRPWFDVLVGTREPWVGTPKEQEHRARLAHRADGASRPQTFQGLDSISTERTWRAWITPPSP